MKETQSIISVACNHLVMAYEFLEAARTVKNQVMSKIKHKRVITFLLKKKKVAE